jgi:hypothetical protein
MKRTFYFLLLVLTSSFLVYSCKDDEEDTQEVIKVKIGAQGNTATGGFYSVAENKVYTMDAAFQNQGAIDILCFYEAENGNNIAIASPGAGISGIFTGDSSPENWTTLDTTYYTKTTLTVEQFDALAETDQLIETSFDPDNSFRKAKNLTVDEIYAFQVQSGTFGIFKVTEVVQGADGSVSFEVKIKK